MINSHLGRFAIVTVAKINNSDELVKELLDSNMHFSEMSMSRANQTELIALLIILLVIYALSTGKRDAIPKLFDIREIIRGYYKVFPIQIDFLYLLISLL